MPSTKHLELQSERRSSGEDVALSLEGQDGSARCHPSRLYPGGPPEDRDTAKNYASMIKATHLAGCFHPPASSTPQCGGLRGTAVSDARDLKLLLLQSGA